MKPKGKHIIRHVGLSCVNGLYAVNVSGRESSIQLFQIAVPGVSYYHFFKLPEVTLSKATAVRYLIVKMKKKAVREEMIFLRETLDRLEARERYGVPGRPKGWRRPPPDDMLDSETPVHPFFQDTPAKRAAAPAKAPAKAKVVKVKAKKKAKVKRVLKPRTPKKKPVVVEAAPPPPPPAPVEVAPVVVEAAPAPVVVEVPAEVTPVETPAQSAVHQESLRELQRDLANAPEPVADDDGLGLPDFLNRTNGHAKKVAAAAKKRDARKVVPTSKEEQELDDDTPPLPRGFHTGLRGANPAIHTPKKPPAPSVKKRG